MRTPLEDPDEVVVPGRTMTLRLDRNLRASVKSVTFFMQSNRREEEGWSFTRWDVVERVLAAYDDVRGHGLAMCSLLWDSGHGAYTIGCVEGLQAHRLST